MKLLLIIHCYYAAFWHEDKTEDVVSVIQRNNQTPAEQCKQWCIKHREDPKEYIGSEITLEEMP